MSLQLLRIRNLAIIEETELELGPGLNVITGETGAGKSILIAALALVLGGRADAGLAAAVLSTQPSVSSVSSRNTRPPRPN